MTTLGREVSMDGRPTGPEAVLVIGMHREELAFGERVAARVENETVAVLRVPEGVSRRRPRADERWAKTHGRG